jgi:hypothetical protein
MLMAGMSPVHACGYHEPTGTGLLAAAYPKALWVRTAVWQAQLAGELPASASSSDAASRHSHGSLLAAAGLMQGIAAHLRSGRDAAPPFAVVLIGPMLWSRFEPRLDGTELQFHAAGPTRGDVVLVTEPVVLGALADRRSTWRSASARGLVRAYGESAKVDAVLDALDAAQ